MLQDILTSGSIDNLNPVIIIINISLSFILSYIVANLYKLTHKGLSYSQSFTVTLVLMSVIGASAIMVIGNSLARAFGLAGALAIIRFRTVIKDPKDIAYIFWALVIGMSCGTQGYSLAVTSTVLISLIILLLSKMNFGSIRKHDYILRFYHNTDLGNEDAIQEVLRRHLKSCTMLNMNAHEGGKVFEFSYNVHFVDESRHNELLKELSALDGITNTYLITATNDVDY